MNKTVKWIAVLFALFHVYNNWFTAVSELWFAAIHFGGFGALCALAFHRREQGIERQFWQVLVDLLLAFLSIGIAAYLILFEDALYARESEFILSDYLFASASVLLAIEFARRTSGWFMPALIVVSLSYILFLGRYVPGVFAFPGLSLETVLYRSYWSGDGMFGMVANISSTFVFMFILFGSFLLKSGAGDFMVRIARSIAGRHQGGAGHVAVVGSGLMGSVSGSAVATTVSTGVITIPMMVRSGFSPRFAAGVEAAASTGGQLMPPVMGAGAFVMASYTQIPYLQIIAVSLLPALLYFLTVAFFVRIEARRRQLPVGVNDGEASTIEALNPDWLTRCRLHTCALCHLCNFCGDRSVVDNDAAHEPGTLHRRHARRSAHHGADRNPADCRRARHQRRHDDRPGQRVLGNDRRLGWRQPVVDAGAGRARIADPWDGSPGDGILYSAGDPGGARTL
jgi:TRAP transporter 4TM/12TM fusion protein